MMKKNEELDQKLEEIINQKQENTENHFSALPLPICISLGAAVGLIIGSFLSNVSLGLCIGLAAGCAVFGIISLVSAKKRHEKNNENQNL